MFGLLRIVGNHRVRIYQLNMDFERGSAVITAGNREVNTSNAICRLTDMLENPQYIRVVD